MCAEIGYPYLPVPVYDGIEIDLDGNTLIKERFIAKKTQAEAISAEEHYRKRFSQKFIRNATPETG